MAKNILKTAKSIGLWVLVAFFVLLALISIPSFASIAAILVALVIAPIEKWQNLLNKFVKRKIKATAIVVLTILMIGTFPTADEAETPNSTQEILIDESKSESTKGTEVIVSTTTVPTESIVPATEDTTPPTEDTTSQATEPTVPPTTTPATEPSTAPTTPTTEPTTTATTPAPEPTTTPTESPEVMVWIPTNGGQKYHSKSSCSKMIDPNYVTKSQAISLGFTPCGKCY